MKQVWSLVRVSRWTLCSTSAHWRCHHCQVPDPSASKNCRVTSMAISGVEGATRAASHVKCINPPRASSRRQLWLPSGQFRRSVQPQETAPGDSTMVTEYARQCLLAGHVVWRIHIRPRVPALVLRTANTSQKHLHPTSPPSCLTAGSFTSGCRSSLPWRNLSSLNCYICSTRTQRDHATSTSTRLAVREQMGKL